MANREFHTKNIKEKAAHLASMFGHGDLPQVNQGLSASSGTRARGSNQVAVDPVKKKLFYSSRRNSLLKPLMNLSLYLRDPNT